ncbi:MAG TPA: hypothetical protein VHI93_06290 [Candidatus Thermoplasmatota archaeon]|nr:hypothetical protein [Candidatus Thermoplasmatota archaeon]
MADLLLYLPGLAIAAVITVATFIYMWLRTRRFRQVAREVCRSGFSSPDGPRFHWVRRSEAWEALRSLTGTWGGRRAHIAHWALPRLVGEFNSLFSRVEVEHRGPPGFRLFTHGNGVRRPSRSLGLAELDLPPHRLWTNDPDLARRLVARNPGLLDEGTVHIQDGTVGILRRWHIHDAKEFVRLLRTAQALAQGVEQAGGSQPAAAPARPPWPPPPNTVL